MTQPALDAATDAPARSLSLPGSRGKRFLAGGAVAVSVLFFAEVLRVLVGVNFHMVIPGRVYRCAQQSPTRLTRVVSDHGIRTVINLRGGNVDLSWYREEGQVTHQVDVAQEDVCLSAGRLPARHEIQRLLDVLDNSEYPVLIHCRRGSDRTGLASAMVLLLQTDHGLEAAQAQLGLRYGHLNLGRTARLDEFFDLYRDWLAREGQEHSPAVFRRWIGNGYLPGGYACSIEPLSIPSSISNRKMVPLRMRVHNTGTTTWRLRPGSNAGIHLGYVVQDLEGRPLANGRSGLFHAEVPAGSSIDLTLALPSWVASGNRYRILVDMVEEQQFWFFQTGSEPWEWEFQARDQAIPAAGKRDAAGMVGLAN